MSTFDPYYKWLGIPPKDQPPNHYRLLGVERFENDVDVIEAAADRHIVFLQTVAAGPRMADSQRLLNKNIGRSPLYLNREAKAAYDATLRVARQGAADSTVISRRTTTPPAGVPVRKAERLPVARPLASPPPAAPPVAELPAIEDPTPQFTSGSVLPPASPEVDFAGVAISTSPPASNHPAKSRPVRNVNAGEEATTGHLVGGWSRRGGGCRGDRHGALLVDATAIACAGSGRNPPLPQRPRKWWRQTLPDPS